MAGRIADAHQNRPPESARLRERLGTPGIPIHGIVGVLLEVRALLEQESIRE
jgi:hypothetical protein